MKPGRCALMMPSKIRSALPPGPSLRNIPQSSRLQERGAPSGGSSSTCPPAHHTRGRRRTPRTHTRAGAGMHLRSAVQRSVPMQSRTPPVPAVRDGHDLEALHELHVAQPLLGCLQLHRGALVAQGLAVRMPVRRVGSLFRVFGVQHCSRPAAGWVGACLRRAALQQPWRPACCRPTQTCGQAEAGCAAHGKPSACAGASRQGLRR